MTQLGSQDVRPHASAMPPQSLPAPALIISYDRDSNHGMRAVLRMSGIGA